MGEAEGQARGDLTALLEALAKAPEPGGAWAEELCPGETLDRFQVLRELGRGGFGAVYEALDRELGRRVALKTLRPGRARDEWAGAAIRAEAQAAARLSHPGIVTLYEACTCEKGPYLVLELLHGETLEERLLRGPVPLAEALEIGQQTARALAYAHGEGLVHRDLKPANLHLGEDGRVKLLDLGLAHLLGGKAQSGGTPAYVAPEQWLGQPVDGKADVFSLGAVLHELLSGRRPFEVKEGRSAALDGEAAPPLAGRQPRRLAALVARCLSAKPGERPTAAQVAEELRGLQQAQARPRQLRRLALLAVAGAAAGALLAGLAIRWLSPSVPAPGPDGRIVVAVADFANETRDPELDGLSDLLITSLEQSQRLRVLTRSRMVDVLRQLGKTGVERIDERLGREVALAAGGRALVVATLRRFEALYAIDLKVLDPVTSEYLVTLKEERAGKASIPGMLDRLSARTRERLRESPGEVSASQVHVAEAVTANPEAWGHYAEGLRHESATDNLRAVLAYRRAVAADPRFALAHYRLAYLGEYAGLDRAVREASMEAAYREVERMPAKERLLFHAWKAHVDGRDADALALYSRAAEAYPLDKEVLYLAGDLYLHQGRAAEALPWFERAVALDPTWPEAQKHLLQDALPMLGRGEEALARARARAEASPGLATRNTVVFLLSALRRHDEALALSRQGAERDPGRVSRAWLLTSLVLAGRYQEAEALARSGVAAPSSDDPLADAGPLAAVLEHQGRRREALAALEPGRAPDLHPEVRRWARWALLMDQRDRRPALAMAEGIRQTGETRQGLFTGYFLLGEDRRAAESAVGLRGYDRELYEGILLWRRGDAVAAAARLRPLLSADPNRRDFWSWWFSYVAFDAHLDAEAIAAADRFEASRYYALVPWRGWGLARLQVRKAEAQARLGDRAAALATVDRLLDRWKQADPDLPLLAEARALRRRLASAPGR
ncbi:MAG: protein kinase [Deltaproteobacteria bacterium]|nr:protein kinase [Deltaproteobacteria bacterium]